MAPNKRRSQKYHLAGTRGRATGIQIKDNIKVANGLQDVNDFFDSDPEEEPHVGDDDEEEEETFVEEGEEELEENPAVADDDRAEDTDPGQEPAQQQQQSSPLPETPAPRGNRPSRPSHRKGHAPETPPLTPVVPVTRSSRRMSLRTPRASLAPKGTSTPLLPAQPKGDKQTPPAKPTPRRAGDSPKRPATAASARADKGRRKSGRKDEATSAQRLADETALLDDSKPYETSVADESEQASRADSRDDSIDVVDVPFDDQAPSPGNVSQSDDEDAGDVGDAGVGAETPGEASPDTSDAVAVRRRRHSRLDDSDATADSSEERGGRSGKQKKRGRSAGAGAAATPVTAAASKSRRKSALKTPSRGLTASKRKQTPVRFADEVASAQRNESVDEDEDEDEEQQLEPDAGARRQSSHKRQQTAGKKRKSRASAATNDDEDDGDDGARASSEDEDNADQQDAAEGTGARRATSKRTRRILRGETDEEDYSPGVRRSRRHRVQPLKYWKNERIVYELPRGEDADGCFVVKAIELAEPTPAPSARHKKRRTSKASKATSSKRRAAKAQAAEASFDASAELEEAVELSDPLAVPVIDWTLDADDDDYGSTTELMCAKLARMRDYKSSANGLRVAKTFALTQQRWSSGFFEMEPYGLKPIQEVKRNFLVFYIIRGQVKVTVHEDSFTLNSGSNFFVPPENKYSIENLTEHPCEVYFVQVKVDQA
eukprot:m.206485 g.206485  ORF g.206485 m.206485 type:complete len:716 (-) comp18501_c1_seq2:152-2299(-)